MSASLPPTRSPTHTRSSQQHPLWFYRMKSLEQDALRAQMVLSKSQEGRGKRGPLERLAEAPSPAPTPSPTPLEGMFPGASGAPPAGRTPNSILVPLDFGLQTSASPGRLVRSLYLRPFPHTVA